MLRSLTRELPALCKVPHTLHQTTPVRWATSKGGGSTRNGRDSNPKFLGVKVFGGAWVEPGGIIIRQRGAKYGIVESTRTVGMGRDHTIYALAPGFVKFWHNPARGKNFVEVVRSPPGEEPVVQYPIAHIKRGDVELAALDKIVARASAEGKPEVLMAASVKAALEGFRGSRVVARKAVEGGGRVEALKKAAAGGEKQTSAQ
jgi:large subunit ribosomal protein L27